MEFYLTLSTWLFWVQFWVILGIVLISLELFDGSLIFFLPVGLGAFVNALLLFLQNQDLLFGFSILSVWHHTLVSFAIFSFVASYCLRYLNFNKDGEDVNKY